jgi:hypothetical protein
LQNLQVFLLGEEFDPIKSLKIPLMLSLDDISTHGVIIGMTGSGKTGLNLILMEEALINGIPVIAVDIKGDLSNLKLSAKTVGLSNQNWPLSILQNRLETFKESEVSIFTPGSIKGKPISLVNCLKPPLHEAYESAANVASTLLNLIGFKSNAFKMREHFLLREVLEYAWKNDIKLTFGEIMRMILAPPFERIGGVDVESFIPSKKRKELAFALNNVIGSPDFKKWFYGVPLDIDLFLSSNSGKAKASIFYLSHLENSERMMFVSLLLQTIYSWMLTKGGANKPRLLLIFDEVYGFLPPFPKNPPSKMPLLSIIKQGRSFGITVFLSTQNPVDIDYKALGNVRLWIIGRLQTANDRKRVMEGMIDADVSGLTKSRHDLETLISSLKQREFVIYNAGEGIHLFRSRQCFSNFVGPLTLEQVVKISGTAKEKLIEETIAPEGLLELPPPVPETIEQYYLPDKYRIKDIIKLANKKEWIIDEKSISLYYEPFLLLEGMIRICRIRPNIDKEIHFLKVVPVSKSSSLIFMDRIEPGVEARTLKEYMGEIQMAHSYRFKVTKMFLRNTVSFKRFLSDFKDYISESLAIKLYQCKQTGEYSFPGEDLCSFEKRQKEILIKKHERELKNVYEKRIIQVSSKLEKKIKELNDLESQLHEAKAFLFVSGITEMFHRKLNSLPRKIRRGYQKVVKIQRQLELKKNEIANLELIKKSVEAEYSEKLNDYRNFIRPLIHEICIRARHEEIDIIHICLMWVPMAELTVFNREMKNRIKINCFNAISIIIT